MQRCIIGIHVLSKQIYDAFGGGKHTIECV